MGQLKQLLPLGNKPIIRHCLESIIGSGVKDVVVVLGSDSGSIIKGIRDLSLNIVFNTNAESEMADSIRIGLKAVNNSSKASLICLSDHPLISVQTIKKIIKKHNECPDNIIIPVYNERRGHPSLFPTNILKEIFLGFNLREIIERNSEKISFLNVTDEGILCDVDTINDYKAILKKKR